MQKNILCYGDSNTWGYVPIDPRTRPPFLLPQRYERNIRWPGRLQGLLGEGFHVIEEGLNGRTTNLDYHVPPDRNGKRYLPSCLYSHAPLDLVVFALGGNDLKLCFGRQPAMIRDGVGELIEIVQSTFYGRADRPPAILLVISGPPQPFAEKIVDENGIPLFRDGINRAIQLADLCEVMARDRNCHTVNVRHIACSAIDGVHLDETGHAQMAECLASKIRTILSVAL